MILLVCVGILSKAQVFWNFKARVESRSGFKIQALRSDNGKKYTSKAFDRFCDKDSVH